MSDSQSTSDMTEEELDAISSPAENNIYADLSSETVENHWAQSVYRFLLDRKVRPSEIHSNYEDGECHISIALPEQKVGIATEFDKFDELLEEGWMIVTITSDQFNNFSSVASKLRSVAAENKRRKTLETVKTTSKPEQRLIDALLAKGVPSPDRNYKLLKPNGRELTTPDMVWEEIMLAFFVDGVWWHGAKENKELLDRVKEEGGDKEFIKGKTSRMEKDLNIRSKMTEDGWTVLSCTDTQLDSDAGVREQVARIQKTMRRLMDTQKALRLLNVDSQAKGTSPQPDEKEPTIEEPESDGAKLESAESSQESSSKSVLSGLMGL